MTGRQGGVPGPGSGCLQKTGLGERVAAGTLERVTAGGGGRWGRSSEEEASAASFRCDSQGSEMGRHTVISPLLLPSRLLQCLPSAKTTWKPVARPLGKGVSSNTEQHRGQGEAGT